MYLWTGIDVDEQVAPIRERVRQLESELGIVNSNLTLPFHISLKMSFEMNGARADEVTDALAAYYRGLSPFEIPVKGIEYHTTIAWIRMEENPTLNHIHEELNKLLSDRFGVGLHEYDRDFLFHMTLCMDEDAALVRRFYEALRDEPLPRVLKARRFLIGGSPSGALGSYRVRKVQELMSKYHGDGSSGTI